MASGKRASMREGPWRPSSARPRKTLAPPAGRRPDQKPERSGERPGEPASERPDVRSSRRSAAAPTRSASAPRSSAASRPSAAARASAAPRRRRPPRRAESDPQHAPAATRASRRPRSACAACSPRTSPRTSWSAGRPRRPSSSRGHAGTPGHTRDPILRVVGVGGAGVNAVDRMIEAEVEGVEFIAMNTDMQSLEQSSAPRRACTSATRPRAGSARAPTPPSAAPSAIEEYDQIKGLLKGADMVFITAGAGGGTGTGAAPVVARIAREVGALTVGIVTKPFAFEGARRGAQADQGVRGAGRARSTPSS